MTLLTRYEAAMERKSKILEIIRSLDLPNNPLDDIIDQVVIMLPALCMCRQNKLEFSPYC